jgi:hypothetical protein
MDRAAAKDRETFCSVKDKKHSPKEKPQPMSRGLTPESFAYFAAFPSRTSRSTALASKPQIKSLEPQRTRRKAASYA